MMRSLFSGVSGLKTHQTRMDVIGNNIANVNTTAYKSQNMVFSDLLYQTTQAASGANGNTGRGGINARQIGLGSKTAAINTAITRQGSAQSTNNPWDVMITGESFFIVNSGSQNFFTRDGSFTIDGAGNLVMASTGYRVMGWQVDEETGDIRADVVSALQVMNVNNLTAPAESTTKAVVSGIVDRNSTEVNSKEGRIMTLRFFDQAGYEYTAKMSVHKLRSAGEGNYYVQLDDIINSDGVSLKKYYNVNDISQIATFGADNSIEEDKVFALPEDGSVSYSETTAADGSATNQIFMVNYNLGEILQDFDKNVMMNMSKDLKVTKIGGAAAPGAGDPPKDVPGGTAVKVEGSVSLDRDVLEKEYGLTYDEKQKQYYYMDGATRKALPLTDRTQWQTVLGKLGGGVTLSQDPTWDPDGKEGTVKLSFTADFTTIAGQASTYNGATEKFGVKLEYPTDAETILEKAYGLHSDEHMKYSINNITPDGHANIHCAESYSGNQLVFNTEDASFEYVGSPEQNSVTLNFNTSTTDMTGKNVDLQHFTNIDIDFSAVSNVNNGKVCTIGMDNGDGTENNLGSGRKYGELIGVEVGQDGKIRASYDNGMTKLLGQIAVAKFANASGLAKAGNNLYSTTMNSGEFDGVGQDITADGEGSMESGVLEMSNVDLAGEFTEMITTQRGFQANSRIITTSDTLLEELVNLKR